MRPTGWGRDTPDVALFTANFGGIDEVKPFPRHPGVDAFYYTDEGTLARAASAAVASWTRVVMPGFPGHALGPRLRSRYVKHQIHRLPEAPPCRWLVWADSSFLFHESAFLVQAAARLRRLPPHRRLLFIPHPDRQTVRQEYEFIRREIEHGNAYLRSRYGADDMDGQMRAYEDSGWNLEATLWCGGFWMVENSEVINRCWDRWWEHTLRWGTMDQLSLPVLLEDCGLEPEAFGVDLLANAFFVHRAHRPPNL